MLEAKAGPRAHKRDARRLVLRRLAIRLGLGVAGCLAVSCASAQIVERAIPDDPVVVDGGDVSGKILDSGVRAYFGVPFAAPPVGELRWREPQPVASWKGVYHADRKGPECIQVLRRHDINHYFGEEATSEDCLYLNIWASETAKPGAKLPVIVYIYGGGFTLGSSGMAMYGGENLARKGIVFVNFNYRVGALGFLAHPELTAESPHHASGDYGFLDQVAALQWIKRNIAKFGGDPDNVTISGQSAGSASVSALEASPLAKDLFQHGFAMSLSFFDDRLALPKLADAEKTGLEVQKALGAASIADMRAIPADKILALQKDCQLGCAGTVAVSPAVDGYFLPNSVPAIFAAGKQNDVPTVAGFTRDESSNALRTAPNLDAYEAAAHKLYGDRAGKFLDLYPAHDDAEAKLMGNTAAREALVETGTRKWALAERATGKAPFYMYMFSRVHPFVDDPKLFDHPQTIGAYHTSDVPYWFQTQDALNLFHMTRNWTPYDRDLADKMSDCLVAFARTGNPSADGVAWPAWTQELRAVRRVWRRHRRALGKRRADGIPKPVRRHVVVAESLARLTQPDLIGLVRLRRRQGRRRAGHERPELQALDAARIGVENLVFEIARPLQDLAPARNTAGGGRHQSADGVDLLRVGERGEIEADRFGHLVERRSRLDDERAAARVVDRDFGLVVLVLDVADDRLDHVLDRDQTVGPAVFVDHQRHMRARHLHAQEKIERRHRGRGVEDRPQDAGVRERRVQPGRRARLRLRVRSGDQSKPRIGCEKDEKIANVNHAARVVERLLVDRQSRVAGGAKQVQHLPQRGVYRDRDNVGARQHHVGDPDVVQRQHVLEDRALLGREFRGGALVDRVLDVLADRARREAEEAAEPFEQPRRLIA